MGANQGSSDPQQTAATNEEPSHHRRAPGKVTRAGEASSSDDAQTTAASPDAAGVTGPVQRAGDWTMTAELSAALGIEAEAGTSPAPPAAADGHSAAAIAAPKAGRNQPGFIGRAGSRQARPGTQAERRRHTPRQSGR